MALRTRMANTTDRDAIRIRGGDPQGLIYKLTRERVYGSRYWREACFGASTADVASLASDLRYLGGVAGPNRDPTPFLCLLMKLLQLSPSRDIVQEFLQQPHFKYAKVLGLVYIRFVSNSTDVYRTLESHLTDYRKVILRHEDGTFKLTHVDEVADELLHKDRFQGLALPRLQQRHVLVESGALEDSTESMLGAIA